MGIFDFLKRNSKPAPSSLNEHTEMCALAKTEIRNARLLKTDLLIMSAHKNACPECAKYQGRVYSISGKSKLFPPLPVEFYKHGRIHEDCGHTFAPYIHGVNDPDLKYTLSVHPLKNRQLGKDIVTFSNRPFEDDRADATKRQYEQYRNSLLEKERERKYWEDYWAQEAIRKESDNKDYNWLQEHFPDHCPKTLTGYRRMKTQNTKNYQKLKQLAAELEKII